MSDPATTIRSVTRPSTAELDRVKGSRFVADISPAASEVAALAFVAQIREREPDASHHCWAFLLADDRARASDDGEPRDTAGAPILRHIRGAGLADLVIVVTRWFGGTKLGRGGLVRAYGDAAALVLSTAQVVERELTTALRLRHPYALTAAVQTVMSAHRAELIDAEHGAAVQLTVRVPRSEAQAFATALVDATGGRVRASGQ